MAIFAGGDFCLLLRPTLRRFKTRLIFEQDFEQDYDSTRHRAAVLVRTCRALLTTTTRCRAPDRDPKNHKTTCGGLVITILRAPCIPYSR